MSRDWTSVGRNGHTGEVHAHVVIDSLRWGGAETLLADFAAGAPEAGIRLTVSYLHAAAGSPAAERLQAHGIEPLPVGAEGLLSRHAIATLRGRLRALQPDLVHTHLEYADLAGGLAARSLGIPSVSTIHVMAWERSPRALGREAVSALARRATARRVICVSDVARDAFLRHRWDRPSRVVTLHNGVRGDARPGAGRAVRAELGLGDDDLVVTMLTVLREGKGHDVATEAVARLREAHPRLRLVVAGDGPARGEIERLVAPLGDAVRLAGHRNDVMALLDATDVLLHPTYVDAFPTALLEAGAASVPVIATGVGGIPEIVDDGATGLLIGAPPRAGEVAAALAGLAADPARRHALGAAGRERFEERFSVGRWTARTRALYDEVLASGGS